MRRIRSWCALVLAIVLVGINAAYQMGTSLSAHGREQMIELEESTVEVAAEAATEAEAKAQAEVEEKVQADAEIKVQADAEAEVQAGAGGQVQAAEVQTTETEVQAEPQVSEAEVVEEAAEVTYDVSIKEPEENGGAVKVWTTGGKKDVSFSEGFYKEMLKEGETLHIEITANGDYEVEKVTDEKGDLIRQISVNEKVYNYEIANVTSDKAVNITYKKVETAKEKTEETGGKKDDSKNVGGAEEAPSEEVKAETEAEKPAQTLTTTVKGGVQIKVTAPEGALPEGATVKAVKVDSAAVKNAVKEAVSEEGKELVSYVAYDITIKDKDGNEIQPDANVRVSINGAWVGGTEKEVYHVENGNAEKVADAMALGNMAVFTAEHFSIYAVTGSGLDELAQWKKINNLGSLEMEEAPDTRIYIYVKLDGNVDTSGWIQNGDPGNWYTIGYIDVPATVCPSVSGYTKGEYYPDKRDIVVQYIKSNLKEINFFNEFVAGAFDLDNVNWNASGFGLKAEKGASNNYPDVHDLTWHLDGLLTIKEETYTLTVNYADESGTLELPDNISQEGLETNTPYEFSVPSYSGYTYTVTDKNNQDVTASVQDGKIKGTITVSDANYTVRYYKDKPEEAADTRIYIYIKLDGDVDASGWIQNGDPGNWHTIGYIDVPVTVCPPVSGYTKGEYYPDKRDIVVQYIKGNLKEINFFNEFVAGAFAFDDVNWTADGFGLKAEEGASNSYPDIHDLTWHLDGLLTIKDDSTEKQRPSLSIEKTAEQKVGGYAAGDEIVYTINVVNDGNVTIKDIIVTDSLTGDTWEVESLKPNGTETFTTTYTVTESDVLAGEIVNVATVSGTKPDGDSIERGTDETVTTVPVSRSIDVTKTVTNAPANGTAYQTGESILYDVVVTNTGNVTLHDISVTDQMQGAAGNAELREGESAEITELVAGASVTLHYTYTVRAADAGATLINSVVAVDDTNTQDDDVTPGEPVVTTPTVTPDGNPTVTPGGNPAGPATPAAIIPAATPVVDAIEGFVRELTESEDDAVPLANNNLEHEHKCCIFHFFVLLISLILLAFFTRSMKKHQEKIFELREELDTELAKRGLPLSNENK